MVQHSDVLEIKSGFGATISVVSDAALERVGEPDLLPDPAGETSGRSAADVARYLAMNVVAAGFAQRCTVQLHYALGVTAPTSVRVDFHGSGNIDEARIAEALRQVMDLPPDGVREHLRFNRSVSVRTIARGHFDRSEAGRDVFAWDEGDLVDALKCRLHSGKVMSGLLRSGGDRETPR
ncbi:methionine adenosyltransferase domain-containing protein [Amorphus orientalis]|uniref:S-adenosylmethionine synthetase C-terminal domain-containing protein n=1 Tax=Amorphus orientalis TaxID=649198 RepID=A0AAE3VMJ5_9HYPH|nr:methionine adenosyltransferase domain-containing protein [Amorphus orientalis]MDQ0314791.1 hypothetical protein [Amorphus orientalis]